MKIDAKLHTNKNVGYNFQITRKRIYLIFPLKSSSVTIKTAVIEGSVRLVEIIKKIDLLYWIDEDVRKRGRRRYVTQH